MVCAKCARLSKGTSLATPAVKRKSELYYGSSASASASAKDSSIKSATQGNSGIGKSKLLSKGAKNPYAAYSAACEKCKVKIDQGKKYCNSCAFKQNACAVCGKSMTQDKKKTTGKDSTQAPQISGQRFSLK